MPRKRNLCCVPCCTGRGHPVREMVCQTELLEPVIKRRKLLDRTGTKESICRPQILTRTKTKLTKVEQALLRKLILQKVKLSKFRNQVKKYRKHLKMANKFMANQRFLDMTENTTSAGKILTVMLLQKAKKIGKGRRFSLKEKIIAWSILKLSPRAYKFLRKVFILPPLLSFQKLVNKANLKPGINQRIFNQLKAKAEKMEPKEKLSLLIFDEIPIQPNLTYNETQDVIKGFATDGKLKNKTIADHALVFMLRGFKKKYEHPLAYTFCSGATNGLELKNLIKDMITKTQEAGFHVVATVCDQGSNNQKAIESLIEEAAIYYQRTGKQFNGKTFVVNNKEIVTLYNPPDLLKEIRNNLLTKNLKYITPEGSTAYAKWQHLELLLKENPGFMGLSLIPKLTENHIAPNKISKTKEKFASQIFSQTVACTMGYLSETGILPAECAQTADILLFFDKLFDSLNSSYHKNKNDGKPYLAPVTPHSRHHKLWVESKEEFKKMAFVNSKGNEVKVKSLSNWIWTIEGVEFLYKKLLKQNISLFCTRKLNMDPIANFFNMLWSLGCGNRLPSTAAFESAFCRLIIDNLFVCWKQR